MTQALKARHDHAVRQLQLGNTNSAIKELEDLAACGFHHSQHSLAWCYETGLGVKKDPQRAFNLYLIAAKEGNEASQTNIGDYYMRGEVVEQDIRVALEWFQLAASKGFPLALYNIAYLMDQGMYGNGALALQNYQLAYQGGHINAANNIGIYYASGRHIEPDLNLAELWFQRGVQSGDTTAAQNLEKLRIQRSQLRR
jgi:hypothetical protein